MHETVFASSLLRIVLEELNKHQTAKNELKVAQIDLNIGLFACLEEQTLKGCFEIMAEETAAKDAQLNIVRLPLEGVCTNCKKKVATLTLKKIACPFCAALNVDWKGGNEMYISTIKVQKINS